MGRCSGGYPPGITGRVGKPEPPLSPEVVAIGHDRQIPHVASIYVGVSAVFPLVFDPVDYVSAISDFSCDTEGVTLSLEPNVQNVLRVTLPDDITPGYAVRILFREQEIMLVTAARAVKIIPLKWRTGGISENPTVEANFIPPVLSSDASMKVKITCGDYTEIIDEPSERFSASLVFACPNTPVGYAKQFVISHPTLTNLIIFDRYGGEWLADGVSMSFEILEWTQDGETIYPGYL